MIVLSEKAEPARKTENRAHIVPETAILAAETHALCPAANRRRFKAENRAEKVVPDLKRPILCCILITPFA
jgi:hypothetical protein